MSMATLERAVLAELKKVTSNNKLKMKNIMEWSTGEISPKEEGEKKIVLPELGINVVYKD